jgi:hypothetical protein
MNMRKRGNRIGSCALALLMLATPARLTAQQLFVNVEPRPAVRAQFTVDPRPTGRLVAGGLAGGATGALAGALIAGGLRFLAPCDDQDGCIDRYADWAFSGAVLGQSVGLPLGVHLANGRQGRLPPALLASAGIGTAGLIAYWGIQRYGTDGWGNTRGNPDLLTAATLVAVPVLELVTSIAIERATTGR